MIIFIEDDESYLDWIDQHPDGYVVNANRRPVPGYLILHRSTCPHISTEARANWTTKQYIKLCSENLEQLQSWSKLEIGGELKPCSVCKLDSKIRTSVAESRLFPDQGNQRIEAGWPLWRKQRQLETRDDLLPLKASWEKSTDPSQVRLRSYRETVHESFSPALLFDCLYLDLKIGLPQKVNVLIGNDLENYLTPLFECGCLPATQFRLVIAEKMPGEGSQISIGIAERTSTINELDSFCRFMVCPTAKPTNDSVWKAELDDALTASNLEPLPEGEVELHVAWKCALGPRSWFRFWKSTCDSMGPILGRYERKNRFDPKDDRITKLVYYLVPDESMGNCVQVGMWWQLRPVIVA